jgi:CDP-glucose 4,6-dehydratase
LEGKKEFAEGWNFGPDEDSHIPVISVVKRIKQLWSKVEYEIRENPDTLYEAGSLKLDCSKARSLLEWKPVWDIEKTIEKTTKWYMEFYEKGKVISLDDLGEYINNTKEKGLKWSY